jgi:hypothetical protein
MTTRIFTREEQGQNHRPAGNTGPALAVMATWIEETS